MVILNEINVSELGGVRVCEISDLKNDLEDPQIVI